MGQASRRNEAVKILGLSGKRSWYCEIALVFALFFLGQTCYVGVLVVSYGRKQERFEEDSKGRGPRNG